ncbi:MAG TPA: M20/M25/M40 family metallo-hydrolase [Gemmatimonadaceae bacterium]
MKSLTRLSLLALLAATAGAQQTEKLDLAAIQKIRDEGFTRSKIMETASWLTDVYGPRLTGSPTAKQAGDWAIQAMKSWGITNPRFESWGPFGRGWIAESFHMQVLSPVAWPVIAYPNAWSDGTNGVQTGEVVFVPYATPADTVNFKDIGSVKGKWVMTQRPPAVNPHCAADASRESPAALAEMEKPPVAGGRGGGGRGNNVVAMMAQAACRGEPFDSAAYVAQIAAQQAAGAGRGGRGGGRGAPGGPPPFNLNIWLQSRGALGILLPGRGDDGTVFPGGTGNRAVDAPKSVPSFSLAAEHYGRIFRILEKKMPVRLEAELKARFTTGDPNTFNIVGEIPGTDPALKDQLVMLGAHFDSWQSGAGATDNAAGSAVMLEAMRILKTLNLPMKRTVRIGLWTGEEEGLLGSRAYVRQHFGYVDSTGQHFTPEREKITGYFNVDNGTGAIRGIYTQMNDSIVPVFKQWLAPFADLGATTVTTQNTGGTDHQSFDAVGIPGFQFIQDPMDYGSRTHHSNMDLYERLMPHDMMQNAVIVAAFVYTAANRDGMLPRKPVTASGRGRGGQR